MNKEDFGTLQIKSKKRLSSGMAYVIYKGRHQRKVFPETAIDFNLTGSFDY